MDKKGLQFVDWAISAGLFIIYLVILFILIGPAFEEDYSPEYLGSIIQSGIDENLSIELIRFPAFLKLEDNPWLSGGMVTRPYKFYLHNLPREFDTLISEEQFVVYNNESSQVKKKDIDLVNRRIEIAAWPIELGILSPPPAGKITVRLDIYFSDYEIFNDSNIGSTSVWGGEQNSTIGLGESISGIFEEKFITFFDGKDYTKVKEDFHFPFERDFTIEVFNGTNLSASPRLVYNITMPDEKDTVSTLVWADWLIHNTTNRTGVTVLVKVW
jgi:hypothetical protein